MHYAYLTRLCVARLLQVSQASPSLVPLLSHSATHTVRELMPAPAIFARHIHSANSLFLTIISCHDSDERGAEACEKGEARVSQQRVSEREEKSAREHGTRWCRVGR